MLTVINRRNCENIILCRYKVIFVGGAVKISAIMKSNYNYINNNGDERTSDTLIGYLPNF